jgi:hypothetical protein
MRREARLTAAMLLPPFCALCLGTSTAAAWGDEGHQVIALIAEHYLTPEARTRVAALLEGDASGLVARDIAHEATWADRYRDSDRDSTRERYLGTREWHFVDLELEGADLAAACHGRPPLPPATPASRGPAEDCVVDKIEQFSAELRDPRTGEDERRLALEFLLHFVGDVHQPLHAGDDHDQGGNSIRVEGPGHESLHHEWDVELVRRLGKDDVEIAGMLIARISPADRSRWQRGSAADWAMETYGIAKAHAYGLLPPPSGDGGHRLTDAYVEDATRVTGEQLSKAGVRLAWLLNRDLR